MEYSMNRILNNEYEYLKIDEKPSKIVLFVFSLTNYPPKKFAMSKILKDTPVTKIYVNCSNNAWYQKGITGLTNSIDETTELFKEILKKMKAKKVYTTGMSMGGYASILFGLLLKANAVLAFTGEVLIGEEYARSHYMNNSKDNDYRYVSLANLIQKNKKTKIYGVYGIYDLIDASLFGSISHIVETNRMFNYIPVSGAHQVTLRLEINRVVEKFLKGKKFNLEDIHPTYTLDQVFRKEVFWIIREVYKYVLKKDSARVNQILSSYVHINKYPQLSLLYGQSYLELEKYEIGKAVLESSVKLDPNWAPIHHLLALAYTHTGEDNLAIESYKRSIALNERASNSMYRLGNLYLKSNSEEKALEYYEMAITVNPRYHEVYYNCAIIHERQNNIDKSIHSLEKAFKINPDKSEYVRKLNSLRSMKT